MLTILSAIFRLNLSQAQFQSALTAASVTGFTIVAFVMNDDGTAIQIQAAENRHLTSAEKTALLAQLPLGAAVWSVLDQ